MRKKIVVLDDLENSYKKLADWSKVDAKAEVTIHNQPLYGEALFKAVKDAQAIVLMRDRTPFKADLIQQLPALEYLVFTGTRNGALDVDALKERQIPISHTGWGPSKNSTSELTWALILGLKKQLVGQNALINQNKWRNELSLLPVLQGQTLGLVGLGEIGQRVAKVALAFGMNVVTWSPNMTPARAEAIGAQSVSLDELLQQSDIVSLHIIASSTTKGLINKEKLALMKKDAILINTSRAVLVETDALVDSLNQGRIGGAAVDVFDIEPLPADHPLRKTPNTLLTPHLGFVAEPVFTTFAKDVVECLEAWLHGQPTIRPLL
ncbi:D-2-hydroxyacid dehydrogenase family protein [Polynucleobacter sp. 30F-ANTBAC]|uniref:D-2-hydroxyacid dehydrogenase family protein n=1 Tax=Polynucleobacter sp. 30F-ANTBAC TaxID=2689095 RepID=UPI001C0B0855|nr:D-2-hydroxyacid dehydrogenase family protein [Polynucleobacter sp. 30F-ANTBAC]MBU3598922.1 D-2-hydroxyacid dehydrogenase family protein [Polynucleobacter sp. 30F-ANTBAC]